MFNAIFTATLSAGYASPHTREATGCGLTPTTAQPTTKPSTGVQKPVFLKSYTQCDCIGFGVLLGISGQVQLDAVEINIGCVHNQKSHRSRFVRRDRSSPMKKNEFVIISHNTLVPVIGHLELPIGTLASHALWAWLTKISPGSQTFSQMPPSRSGFDCERGAFRSE